MSSNSLLDIETLESLAVLGERRGKDLIGQLVDLFTAQGPEAFAKLRRAVAAGDADGVSATAHSLKGSYRSLGTRRLAEIATELETRGRERRLEGLDPWLDDLETTFDATREGLEAFVAGRRGQPAGD